MSQHSRPFGDLHKVRGPGHLRCADGKARQEDSLGWDEAAKARDGRARNRHRQRGLVGAKGLKPGRQGRNTGRQRLGLARSEWTAWVVDQAKTGVRTLLGAKG